MPEYDCPYLHDHCMVLSMLSEEYAPVYLISNQTIVCLKAAGDYLITIYFKMAGQTSQSL